ncbi:MAG: Gfo/Idh/MocA family protein [Blastocatellia bacterium]
MNKPISPSGQTTRRRFLGQSALTGAAAFVPAGLYGQTARRKIHIGIAGGRFGLQFYWHEHPDCIVEAVTDLLPGRRAELMQTYQCAKSYPSLEEMVKDPKLDAIAVFTDGPLHFRHVMLALAHGKHVISAVPAVMAPTASEALDQAHKLFEKVQQTGLTYMMAETSVWRQEFITLRQMHEKGELGQVISCDADYMHPGLRELYGTAAQPTWRYGVPPMFYPTHCTAFLAGLTGETLTRVSCHGWGNDDPICKRNAFGNNPFWNETAHFGTSNGTAFRVRVWWEAPVWGGEYAIWHTTKMTVDQRHGLLWSHKGAPGKDDAGFAQGPAKSAPLAAVKWWQTDLLPERLRHDSGHGGSHTFIAHEFIDSLTKQRRPLVDIAAALHFTVPGIVAHQSALKGGESLKIPRFGRVQ